jgi:hypothetical protein
MLVSGYLPLILYVCSILRQYEMIGSKLHLDLVFTQLEQTEYGTCIVSSEQKDFGQLDPEK